MRTASVSYQQLCSPLLLLGVLVSGLWNSVYSSHRGAGFGCLCVLAVSDVHTHCPCPLPPIPLVTPYSCRRWERRGIELTYGRREFKARLCHASVL